MFKTTVIIISAFLLAQGCSNTSVKQKPASVTSSPTGADVYANGVKLGQTPLQHNLYKAFPAGWKNLELSAQGVLLIKKQGCQDYMLSVNDRVLSKPIHADLECKSVKTESVVAPVMVEKGDKSPLGADEKPASAVEQRLLELDSLFKKGVISLEEYKRTRERILGEI